VKKYIPIKKLQSKGIDMIRNFVNGTFKVKNPEADLNVFKRKKK